MSGSELLLFSVITVSGYTDLKYRKIYNIVLFPALILALINQLWVSGLTGLFSWGQGLILGLVFLFVPFLLGGMGAGDVKLLGVIGAIRGPVFVFYCFLAAAMIGGLMSVCVLLYRRKLSQAVGNIGSAVQTITIFGFGDAKTALPPEDEGTSIPYGLAIALGAMTTYLVI